MISVLATILAFVVRLDPAAAASVSSSGLVGSSAFKQSMTVGKSGRCYFSGGRLSTIAVAAPLAAMRSTYRPRYVAQYVEFVTTLQGYRAGSWSNLAVSPSSPRLTATKVGSSWTQVKSAPAFTGSVIKTGYSLYRVVEQLWWLDPADSSRVVGKSQLVLATYWGGSNWGAYCRSVPTPVVSLKGTSAFVSAGHATTALAWTKPSGTAATNLTGLKVCRGVGTTRPSSSCTGLVVLAPSATGYVDKTAVSGATYTYGVFSRNTQNAYNNGTASTVAPAAVPPPTALRCTGTSDASSAAVSCQWTASAAGRYLWRFDANPWSAPQTSTTGAHLTGGYNESHTLYVQATDGAGHYSSVASLVTMLPAPPSATVTVFKGPQCYGSACGGGVCSTVCWFIGVDTANFSGNVTCTVYDDRKGGTWGTPWTQGPTASHLTNDWVSAQYPFHVSCGGVNSPITQW